ncbi:putative asparagine synthase [Gymnopilus junonius]|uniref:Asparagine synthase n=1 Tax=Gymnopilus junonius TaxID=109634 RepID=A0A9P5NFZ1_GYMJU|nr:putative asparagine synthase [Gymnopilus junonius]
MCGITASYVTSTEATPDKSTLEAQLKASIRVLKHRGPDASGTYISNDGRVGLGHARLSIIDVEGGHQPLHDSEGTVHAVVNGELYDYADLRQKLEEQGRVFQTFSDSELVIHLYKVHGYNLVQFLRGEFAFIIYDSERKVLFAVRDRFGVKPIYYTLLNERLLIASEMKALMKFGWKPEWDVHSIVETGEFNDNRTVFKGVYKLPTAHQLIFTRMGQLKIQPYWDHTFNNRHVPETRSVEQIIQGVRERMVDAVRARLRSDVPLAVSLSGGLDSASIAGIASALLKEKDPAAKVVTFTLAFPERGDRQAEFIGAECHMVKPSEADLIAKFDDVVYHCEHAMVLNETIRRLGYKVCLTGEGSDENQGGYSFLLADFLRAPDPAAQSLGIPLPSASELQTSLEMRQGLPPPQDHVAIDEYSLTDQQLGRAMLGGISFGRFWATLGLPMKVINPAVLKEFTVDGRSVVVAEGFRPEARAKMIDGTWHPFHSALYSVSTIMLPLLLNQVGDRPELANSIEGRQPFTDHKLVEYMNTVPPYIIENLTPETPDGEWTFTEKWVLRQAVKPFVTEEIYSRRKAQYNAPIPHTKQNGDASGMGKPPLTPLQVYLKERVTQERVDRLGFLNWGSIGALLDEYYPETPKDGGLDRRARVLLSVSGYTVLQDKFNVPTAVF